MKLLLLITSLLILRQGNAQPIHIDGDIADLDKDSVTIYVTPYFSYYMQSMNSEIFNCMTTGQKFSFDSKPLAYPSYVTIVFQSAENSNKDLSQFFATPGDSIHLMVTKDTILFSGKGSEKFTCQYQMQKVPEVSFTPAELAAFNKGADNNRESLEFNMFRKKRMDSLYSVQLGILNGYKPVLPGEVYLQLKLDCKTGELFKFYNSLSLQMEMHTDSASHFEQLQFFKFLENDTLPLNTDVTLLANSKCAADFLMCKAITIIGLDQYKKGGSAKGFKNPEAIASLAASGYTGPILERLRSLSFFLFYRPESNIDVKAMADALAGTSNPYFRKILESLQSAMDPGSDAYPFELTGLKNTTVRLAQFKGKVLVIDFWFTGCAFCIELENEMKVIRKRFLKDTTIVFLSVCLDEDKDTWLKSIATGKYTGKESVNAYSAGLGIQHPLPVFYYVSGCPEIIIIGRDQKIFYSKPAIPKDEETDRNFINLLKRAEAYPGAEKSKL